MHHYKTPLIRAAMITAAFTLQAGSSLAQTCQNPTPVWSDEFDGTSLDTTKWDVMLGDGCSYGICGWGNNELQSYQAENAQVSDGTLKIIAKKERVKAKNYTSARIRTANVPAGGQWTNGRFEARIKLPNGAGMWPAFWMLPTDPDIGWPESGEIDIMEATGQADMFAFGTLHYGQPWPDNEWTSGRILKQPDAWSNDFHVYAVEWEPGQIRWYVDDILYSTKTPDDLSDPSYWTFENYQYHFLLNVAVGGSIGGTVDDSALPQIMEVDYVRVYDFGQPSLTGSNIVESGSTETYSVVDNPAGPGSYSWTTPTGETSTSKDIAVNWGTDGGAVAVTVSNSCGTRDLQLDVHVLPDVASETVLDNFEGEQALTYTFWNGTFDQAAGNPAPDTINNSALVARHDRDSASQWDVIAASTSAVPDVAPFISGEKAFYMDVYTAAPVGTEILIQLENSNTATPDNYPTGRHSKYIAHTETQNAWQRLRFQLEDRVDGGTSDTDVDSVILLIDPNSFNSDTYYLDNLAIYGDGGSTPGGPATSMSVASISTGTQGVGRGQKLGTATVTVLDDLGAPVEGAVVTGNFSGTWNESASGTTGSDGTVTLVTSSSASGGVSVDFCVTNLSGTLPHDTADSTGLCP